MLEQLPQYTKGYKHLHSLPEGFVWSYLSLCSAQTKVPKRVGIPRSNSLAMMGRPGVSRGTKLQLFTVVTTLLMHHLWFLPFLVLLCYPLKIFQGREQELGAEKDGRVGGF